jgi:hypothetical protein
MIDFADAGRGRLYFPLLQFGVVQTVTSWM